MMNVPWLLSTERRDKFISRDELLPIVWQVDQDDGLVMGLPVELPVNTNGIYTSKFGN